MARVMLLAWLMTTMLMILLRTMLLLMMLMSLMRVMMLIRCFDTVYDEGSDAAVELA